MKKDVELTLMEVLTAWQAMAALSTQFKEGKAKLPVPFWFSRQMRAIQTVVKDYDAQMESVVSAFNAIPETDVEAKTQAKNAIDARHRELVESKVTVSVEPRTVEFLGEIPGVDSGALAMTWFLFEE